MGKVPFFILFSLIALAAGLRPIANGFRVNSNDPAQVSISVIDESAAKDLFRELARDKRIPFGYKFDGCFTRATQMTDLAKKRHSVVMGRVYAEGVFAVKGGPETLGEDVFWGWHVAPVAYVEKPDHTQELLVFDPSLATEPIPIDEWTKKMMYAKGKLKPKLERIYYGGPHQYYPKGQEGFQSALIPDFRSRLLEKDIERFRKKQRELVKAQRELEKQSTKSTGGSK